MVLFVEQKLLRYYVQKNNHLLLNQGDYYVDSDNSSGMIHFEPDRSIAEKGRLIRQWKADGTPVMVEKYAICTRSRPYSISLY